MSYPAVQSRADLDISSPIKIHGNNGSNGTSCKNVDSQKKNPAATNGAYLGTDGKSGSNRIPEPNLMICHSICAVANSESHIRYPIDPCQSIFESGGYVDMTGFLAGASSIIFISYPTTKRKRAFESYSLEF